MVRWTRLVRACGVCGVLGLAGGASSCSSSSAAQGPPPIEVLQLVQSPWDASRIDAAIARILITEQLGMAVQVTELDEYAQWEKIASGELHASLEVWPSGHKADIATYVDTGRVENGGALGPIGKIGWYIPSYMLTTHPDLSTWTTLKQSWAVDLFKTADTAPQGRFLAGDQTWTQYDADIIHNLQLDFAVKYAGSEADELAALDRAYQSHDAILMYMWTPQWALAKYDMTEVKLPDYSDACYAKAAEHGIDCGYPPEPLFKILWPGLVNAAPRAHVLLQRFKYTTADQIALLARVHEDGVAIDAAAREWINANPAVWHSWLQ